MSPRVSRAELERRMEAARAEGVRARRSARAWDAATVTVDVLRHLPLLPFTLSGCSAQSGPAKFVPARVIPVPGSAAARPTAAGKPVGTSAARPVVHPSQARPASAPAASPRVHASSPRPAVSQGSARVHASTPQSHTEQAASCNVAAPAAMHYDAKMLAEDTGKTLGIKIDEEFIATLSRAQIQTLKILVSLVYQSRADRYKAEPWVPELAKVEISKIVSSADSLKQTLDKLCGELDKCRDIKEYLSDTPGKDHIETASKSVFILALSIIVPKQV